MNKIEIPTSVDDMIAPKLRAWLFQYYDEIEDYDSYEEINENARNYHSMMTRNSLPEDLERRSSVFMNNDMFTLGIDMSNDMR